MLEVLKQKFGSAILDHHQNYGDETVVVDRASILEVMKFLKQNAACPFNLFLDLGGVDYPNRNPRFELVYHLYSLPRNRRIRIKTALPESDLKIRSVISVWESADWFEREAFDMFGIHFEGHPNLKRLLMWEGFQGHPLRKDYPIDKRQPIPVMADLV